MDGQRLGDDLLDGEARVERAEGVLEDDLHLAAGFAQGAGAERGDLDAVKAHDSAGGFDEAQQHAAESALAAAGLADQAEGLARFDGEGDVIDGAQAVVAGLRPQVSVVS